MKRHVLLSLWCFLCCRAFSTPAAPQHKKTRRIPITVISGFLGSGKTSLLQHLLENKEGIKIAVIVNDVASVNIDSKLVSGSNSADGMVELQNGCACCSLAQELLGSVAELVTLSDMRGEDSAFDHIVVELSGVADPKGVRSQFQEASFYNMPIMERVSLDTMVTLIDCSTFLKHLRSSKVANLDESPELFYPEGEAPPEMSEDPDWMDDIPAALRDVLMAGGGKGSAAGLQTDDGNAVSDLLVSQTEIADLVLLNKVDIVENTEDLETINQIVVALNPKARISKTTFGKMPLSGVLAFARGKGVVEAGVVDDHRDAVHAAEQSLSNTHQSHDHDHDCADPDCADNSHSHSHEHRESISSPDGENDCNDPGCNDPTHSHSHESSHSHSDTTTLSQLGITSFVYRARRPFHPQRLIAFLRHLPISRGLPEKGGDAPGLQISEDANDALQRVVRSKGFAWLADSNVAASYWSHAGSSFELQVLGRWWSTLSRAEWPPEAKSTILADFDVLDHDDQDPKTDSVGDRRQEVVFIGPGLQNENRQAAICSALDQCLLNDAEWADFRTNRMSEPSLRSAFANDIPAKMLSY